MASLNKVMLIGNLGKDPEIHYSIDGTTVASLNLATTDSWKNKNGEKQDRTEWHRCVFFGRLAEVVGEYVKKGGSIYVEGRLQTRKWQDKDGQDRYTTEIVCESMQMLGSARGPGGNRDPDEAGASSQRPAQRQGGQSAARPPHQPQKPQSAFSGGGGFDDDIPFSPIKAFLT